MNDYYLLLIFSASCYLIGSISFGTIISKLVKNIDITTKGSGNTGATNVLRSVGIKSALLVLFLDMIKSIIPLLLIDKIQLNSINYATQISALFLILGHCYPLYHNFKGGKGVAPGVGPLFILFFPSALLALIIFVISIFFTRMVSIGSIAGCLVALISMILFNLFGLFDHTWVDMVYLTPAVLIILFKHNQNLKRIYSGTENKLSFKK